MAVDGQVAHDPTSRSLLVKAKAGYGALFWRRGHQAMLAAIESGRYYDAPTVRTVCPVAVDALQIRLS
jgi:hypothetical protein